MGESFFGKEKRTGQHLPRLVDKHSFSPHQANVFFDALLCARTAWSPEDVQRYRSSFKRLEQINKEIASLAAEVAELIRERCTIENTEPLHSGAHYSITNVIRDASANNGYFTSYLEGELSGLGSGPIDFRLMACFTV
ncbi:MAG: hypothetical protein JJ868_12465 [Shimia sp.]|uniref:hypothetical protein n=1 Tax=Shimia sp. TaxID=1954381 RepID=UPI001B2A0A4F|nr:hypothetical protein [Shimia sp.]MBO6898178.1 hypothetical protein [Shimia sp.]